MRHIVKSRIPIIAGILFFVFILYGIRLMQLQIVQGKQYLSQMQSKITREVVIKAARGEILDRYGRPIAVNRMGYNITFDGAYLKMSTLNSTILKLSQILTDANETWNDSLPVSVESGQFEFIAGRETDVELLKKNLNLNTYATIDNVMTEMRKKYNISDKLSNEQQRLIAGVRYEMTRRGFTISIPYTFAQDVSISTVVKVSELGDELTGVDITEEAIREYPMGNIAPHIIGYIGPIYAEEYKSLKNQGYNLTDLVGKQGVEKAYESILRGTDGIKQIELNSSGDVIAVREKKPAIPGNTVILTLDARLQLAAQQSLEKRIKELQSKSTVGAGKNSTSGAVVVVSAKTGEVLAAATYPSYNIQTYTKDYSSLLTDPNNPLFNRALSGLYSPGSTFKPAVAMASLANGIVDESSTVTCNHIYTYFDGYSPQCEGYHGATSLMRAMAVSCNIYFYDVGRRTGITAINEYASKLGLGKKTGIEISEAEGHLAGPEIKKKYGQEWYAGDVIQAAIGQSDNRFSVLQMAVFMGTIGNNGVKMQTHMIKSIKSFDLSNTIKETEIKTVETIENKNDCITLVKKALLYTAQSGSGRHAFGSYAYKVGAKTGSPQTSPTTSNAFYTAFGPYDDCEIATAVVIEGATNGTNAGSVARDVFDAYFFEKEKQNSIQNEGVLLN